MSQKKKKLSKKTTEKISINTEPARFDSSSLHNVLQARQVLLEKHVNYYKRSLQLIRNEKHKLMIEQLQIKAALHQVLTNGEEVTKTPNQSEMLSFEPDSVNTIPLSLNI